MTPLIEAAFAAVPRDLWSDGPLWREPDDAEAAYYLRHAGAVPEPPPRLRSSGATTVARRATVERLRGEGWTAPQIAAHLGVTVNVVDYDIRTLRIAAGQYGATVAEYAARRARIVELLDTGRTYRQIAKEAGASWRAVCDTARKWRKARQQEAS